MSGDLVVSIMATSEQQSFDAAAGGSPAALSIVCTELHSDETVGDGAVDFRGRPCIRSRTGNWRASALIIGCEACERVGTNAIGANLVGYLATELHEDLAAAVKNANNWNGTVRVTPIIAAIIADSYLGRFLTITIFMSIYFLAQVMMTTAVTAPSLKPPECEPGVATSCPAATGLPVSFYYGALYVMALGAGGIRACVFPMSGDQFEMADATEAKRKLSHPKWYFIAITAGNFVGVSALVYAQSRLGWSWGYGIPAGLMALFLVAYFGAAPWQRNRRPSPGSNPIVRVAQVLVAAARNWRAPAARTRVDANSRSLHVLDPSFLDKAATAGAGVDDASDAPEPWKRCTVTQVEEVKALARMLPIWMTNIIFWVVYAQVSTLFLSQGTTLDRRIAGSFQIPSPSMPLFLHLSICLFLPVYDKFLVPLARKHLTGHPRGFTLLQRIGIGQAISVLPITIAALVEVRRMRFVEHHSSESSSPLPMSIFWLLPQYALMGVTEAFLSVGQIEFFTEEAPPSMRSLGNAMACCANALGCFGSSLLMEIVAKVTSHQGKSGEGWIRNNVNDSHIDYFYWLLTVLTVVNLLVFLFFARRHKYSNRGHETINKSETRTLMVDPTSSRIVDKRIHPASIDSSS